MALPANAGKAEMLALAKRWQDATSGTFGSARLQLLRRARHWYVKAGADDQVKTIDAQLKSEKDAPAKPPEKK